MDKIPSKMELRKAAREKRAALAKNDMAAALAAHAASLNITPGMVVGGYHAINNEADPALLLAALAEAGAQIAFPRIADKIAPLEFHVMPQDAALEPGAMNILEPQKHWPGVTPDVLLVPLLAFDASGHRLGYGGGYYDRTLAALPAARAIGIAYAGQEVFSLPVEAHDKPLAAILTELGLRHFP